MSNPSQLMSNPGPIRGQSNEIHDQSDPIKVQFQANPTMSRLTHYFKLTHANPGPIIDQSSTEKPMDSQLANPRQSMPIQIGQSLG